ncbi:MAG: HlyD family efflux transporter periplasmic adaptor subunit [Geobacteraceae bacterium]|nr:HlyD family efflux transporter periplasmic adaptor subunit [Geobacteraceae bacterium]NTW81407.1 HlyD family efflux transporter periplasmic adaptor subunit [Geobacteraceae bacterium]
MKFILFSIFTASLCTVAGCNRTPSSSSPVQGYVEGEFVYISAPMPGRLETLFVQRGTQVKAGDPLFELENVTEKAARDETKLRLAQTRAQLADSKKGKRPTEIGAISAQLNLARAALQFSEKELARQDSLFLAKVVSQQDVDRLRSVRDQDRQRVAQLEAELGTARLGSRSDQIAAAEASTQALEATLTRSEWDLAQKRQSAPQSGLVFDTLYRKGEWIAAGRPAVVLLPPQNTKVRAFVAEPLLASIRQGERVRVTVDGGRTPFFGTVNFISPQAEYTPPVIYSRESRQKLVYMIEIAFDQTTAVKLHPGQPVDILFGSAL